VPSYLHEHKIAFFGIPKAGTSTVKHAFAQVEATNKANVTTDLRELHTIYRTDHKVTEQDFADSDGYWRFTIIRDPIERIVSTYQNRILQENDHKTGKWPRLRATLLGVSLEPSLNEFCSKLPRYRLMSRRLRAHMLPVQNYIGDSLQRFDAVYRMDEMDRLEADLKARTGVDISLQRMNPSGNKNGFGDLNPKAIRSIKRFTRGEYRLIDGLYEFPDTDAF
jgi:hypothetical protein